MAHSMQIKSIKVHRTILIHGNKNKTRTDNADNLQLHTAIVCCRISPEYNLNRSGKEPANEKGKDKEDLFNKPSYAQHAISMRTNCYSIIHINKPNNLHSIAKSTHARIHMHFYRSTDLHPASTNK